MNAKMSSLRKMGMKKQRVVFDNPILMERQNLQNSDEEETEVSNEVDEEMEEGMAKGPVQTFFIPLAEKSLIEDTYSAVITPSEVQSIHSVISLLVKEDHTVVYYDHWEDDFEADILNPTMSSTQIWGDGDATNGCQPKIAHCTDKDDVLYAGDVIVLVDHVDTRTRDWNQMMWDGGDRVEASAPLSAVRRKVYPEPQGDSFKAAVKVMDTSKWVNEYTFSRQEHDENSEVSNIEGLYIMASENDTQLSLPNGEVIELDIGENYFLHIPKRAAFEDDAEAEWTVTSNRPLQIHHVYFEEAEEEDAES